MKKRNIIRLILNIICTSHIIILLSFGIAAAIDRDELRVKAGLDLFPSLLTADLDIENKKGSDGFITILLVYTDNRTQATEMALALSQIEKIRNIPIRVEISNDLTMNSHKDRHPAGIYITQPLDEKLSEVVRFAIENGIVLFSPFKGDVEKGVLGGIYISDRVLPYINLASMESSGINIKKFFIKVSVSYEP